MGDVKIAMKRHSCYEGGSWLKRPKLLCVQLCKRVYFCCIVGHFNSLWRLTQLWREPQMASLGTAVFDDTACLFQPVDKLQELHQGRV